MGLHTIGRIRRYTSGSIPIELGEMKRDTKTESYQLRSNPRKLITKRRFFAHLVHTGTKALVVNHLSLHPSGSTVTPGGGGGHSPWFWVPTAKRTPGAVAVG